MARYVNARFTRSEIIQRLYNYAGLARGKYQRLDIHFGVEHAIHTRSGLSTGEILAINEFGSPSKNIPSRPFMRTSTEEMKKVIKYFVRAMRKRKKPWVGSIEANEIGRLGRTIIQDTIINWDTPPNAPSTVKRKGFDNPLLETELLQKSVEYDIQSYYN